MYMSTRHQEGLALLLYGINHGGGFVALTGEVGTGKTTLCHCLLQQLPKNIDIALILNPKVNAVELLATICDELRIDYDPQQQTLKNLVDALNRYLLTAHAIDRRTVLVIDEAQNLSLEVLEQIRLLTNLETSKTKLLQIILVGQPELKDLLSRKELRQLNQRITARYHLLPLSLDETRIYIRHRLTVCHGDPDLFKESAVKKIYQASKGIPRLINTICHCALLGAYSSDTRSISPSIINRAAREALAFAKTTPSYVKPLVAAITLTGLAAIGFYLLQPSVNSIEQVKAKTILSGKFPRIEVENHNSIASKAVIAQSELSSSATNNSFKTWLDDSNLTLSAAITEILKLWGKPLPAGKSLIDCSVVVKNGLNCLFSRSKWQDLASLNRPAILEFTLTNGVKRYALLTKIQNDQPVLYFGGDKLFPLADVLSIWDGYYLLLWQSPSLGMKSLSPGQSNNHVLWLRQQLALVDSQHQDGNWSLYFDNALKKRVVSFQKSRNLVADGKVSAQTIIHLDNLTGARGSPRLIQAN